MLEVSIERPSYVDLSLRNFYSRVLEHAFNDLVRNGKQAGAWDDSPTARYVRQANARHETEKWFFTDGYQAESITVSQCCDALNIPLSRVREKAREIIKINREKAL